MRRVSVQQNRFTIYHIVWGWKKVKLERDLGCLVVEAMVVREGFGIPCGRGNGWTAPFYYIVLFVVFAGEFTFVPYECACCIKFFSPLDAVLKEFL
jgi:hypothetical protein